MAFSRLGQCVAPLVLFTVLCSHAPGAAAATQFRMRLQHEPQTFDWNLAHTQMETPVAMNIMEGLVAFGTDMKIKPALAKSWTVSEDRLTYVFKLRENVRWSDGKPFRAEDVLYSWQRLLDPMTASPYAYFLFDLRGAEDFNAGKNKDFSKVGVRAVDPLTVEVKLRRPLPYFLQLLSFWVTFPLRRDVVQEHGSAWSRPENIVVLGPFIPAPGQPMGQILLKRNERYYGARPAMDSVLLRVVSEDSTALNLFQAGALDVVWPINFLELGSLVSSPAFHSDPYYRTCFININTNKYPMNLPKVRRALAMSIDRSKIPDALHLKVGVPRSLVHPGVMPEDTEATLPFNPTEAKKSLQEVGIDPKSALKVDLLTYGSDLNTLLSQYLQDQVKKNLGLQLNIQMNEYKVYRTKLELGAAPLALRCWGVDYVDPDSYLMLFQSQSGNSHTNWKHARYDELVKKAAEIPDGPQRRKVYAEALKILLRDEAVVVPLYYDTLTYLLNPKVKGFRLNPLNYVNFRDIRIEQ